MRFIYSRIRLLATRVLLIKWLLILEVANRGTELTYKLHLGPEDWLLRSNIAKKRIPQ